MLNELGVMQSVQRTQPDGAWTTQPVNKDDVLQILKSAVWAPNDGLREPWRFVYVSEDACAQAMPAHTPAPAHLVVVATQKNTAHIQLEDRCAVYGLIQNIRLLLRTKGLGVRITTAGWMAAPATRYQLGITAEESIVAVLDIGFVTGFSQAASQPAIRLAEW